MTAFNTGTGVIESYRGRQIIDKLYAHAIPIFKENGVTLCALEVIQGNARAIRVYERIGFQIVREFPCFMGDLPLDNIPVEIEKIELTELFQQNQAYQSTYSWDFVNGGIQQNLDKYEAYFVKEEGETIGYFIINPENGTLAQNELFQNKKGDWKKLFAGIKQVHPFSKMNNVDGQRKELIEYLKKIGLENKISQYEMVMKI